MLAAISRVDSSHGADALGNKWDGGGEFGGNGPTGVIGVDNRWEGGGEFGGNGPIGRIGHSGAEICFGGSGAITTRTYFAGGGVTTDPHLGYTAGGGVTIPNSFIESISRDP